MGFLSQTGWRGHGLSLVLGLMIAAGQPPFGFWALMLLGLAGLCLRLFQQNRIWQTAWTGWFAGLGYFALTLNWIVEPFLVDAARHGWMAPFALILMAGGLALFWGAAAAAAMALRKKGLPAPLAIALMVTLSELGRAYLFTGFPWGLISYAWLETPLAQAAAWIGPYALTTATVLGAAGLAMLARRNWRWAPVVLILPALWFAGAARLPDGAAPLRADGYSVRITQPNAPQHLKWQPDMVIGFFMRGLLMNRVDGDADVILWPEISVPIYAGDAGAIYDGDELTWQMMTNASRNTPIIAGANHLQRRDGETTATNALVVVGEAGARIAQYDKHHLVPFGEYLPFARQLREWGIQGIAENLGIGYAPGIGPSIMHVDGPKGPIPPYIPLICYEVIFPHEIRDAGPGAEWMVNLTNDAWFGGWSGPEQHLAQARFRTIETGLPLARSANTGISAMIDPYGRITAQIALNDFGHVDAALPRALQSPLYAKTGDLPLLALILLCCIAAFILSAYRKKV